MNDKVLLYKKLLYKFNKTINLTSIKENYFEEKILIPAKSMVEVIKTKFKNSKSILDIASGGGQLGVILSIFLPKIIFYLVEPRQKRTSFLEIVKHSLKLGNLIVEKNFFEKINFKADIAVVRAFKIKKFPKKEFLPKFILTFTDNCIERNYKIIEEYNNIFIWKLNI